MTAAPQPTPALTRAEVVERALRLTGLRRLNALRRIMATEEEIAAGRKVINASPG